MVFDRKRLKRMRELRGASREEVAKAAGLKSEAYDAFEGGREEPSAFWQQRIAKALKCRPEDFAKRWKEAPADG